MKTTLYMGISINGYIAKENGDSQWTSDEDLKGFYDHSKEIGNLVMGKNTFREALKYGYFPFPDALNIVVSHESIENKWGDKVLITDKSPHEVLTLLQEKGFEEVFLIGGGKLNSAFAREKLIDEIFVDVEPLVFGRGIRIFDDENFELNLKLLDMQKLNESTVQLHYEVLK